MRILGKKITSYNFNDLKINDHVIVLQLNILDFDIHNNSNSNITLKSFDKIWFGIYEKTRISNVKYTDVNLNTFFEHSFIPCNFQALIHLQDFIVLHITDKHSIQLINAVHNIKGMFKLINELHIL